MTIELIVLLVLGLLLYLLAPGKASDVGRVVFFCALLAICFGAGGHHLIGLR